MSDRSAGVNRPLLLGVLAMLVVAGAAYLPWFSASGQGLVDGVDTSGRITLVMAAAGLVATALGSGLFGGRLKRTGRVAISAIGAVITVMTASGAMNPLAGPGLYLTLVGGLVWAFALIWEFNDHKRLDGPRY